MAHRRLYMDNSGSLYGTTVCDGANDLGNVFKLTNTQNGWEYTSLHDFTGGTDGAYPVSNVTIRHGRQPLRHRRDRWQYNCNPPDGCGTVWMIKP